jgi:hypothetical protein
MGKPTCGINPEESRAVLLRVPRGGAGSVAFTLPPRATEPVNPRDSNP